MANNIKPGEFPEYAARNFPQGKVPEKRMVIRKSRPEYFYEVGDILRVHIFGTFGCWDIKGRWVDYYDISSAL